MAIDFSQGMAAFSGTLDKGTVDIRTIAERLDGLGSDFATARDKGVFIPLPTTAPDRSRDRSRIKAIRNRLANLGYLAADSGQPVLDPGLTEAIRAFQEEAGLTIDGWVGEETWGGLQELVSFESPMAPLRWLRDGKPRPALIRALALRLFILGLLETKPAGPNVDLTGGWQAFGRIWQWLSPAPPDTPAGPTVEWIDRLFDQDRLVSHLAAVGTVSSTKDLTDVHGFVLSVARIELWLMGYPVRPAGYDLRAQAVPADAADAFDGMDAWMKSRTVTRFLRIKKNMPTYKSLFLFWRDHGETENEAERKSVDFLDGFPDLFRIMAEGLDAHARMSDTDKQIEIEQFLTRYPERIPTIWDTVRSLGGRIWDGIRRAWAWLKNLAQRAAAKVITIGRNISRLIYDYALDTFSVVSNIWSAVSSGLTFVTHRVFDASDPKSAIVSHDLDFDFRVTIHAGADPPAVAAISDALLRRSRIFVFDCRLLALFVSILWTVIKNGRFGYIGLVFALVSFRGQWPRIQALARTYHTLFSPDATQTPATVSTAAGVG